MKCFLLAAFAIPFGPIGVAGVANAARDSFSESRRGPLGEHVTASYFPACDPEEFPNADCTPPEIDDKNAAIELGSVKFKEEKDPDSQCPPADHWGTRIQIKVRITASDPSGVKAIGVYVKQVVDQKEIMKPYWSSDDSDQYAPTKDVKPKAPAIEGDADVAPTPRPDRDGDSQPRTIEMFKTVFACVPKGRSVGYWVSDLCATDQRDNGRCVPYSPKPVSAPAPGPGPGPAVGPAPSNGAK